MEIQENRDQEIEQENHVLENLSIQGVAKLLEREKNDAIKQMSFCQRKIEILDATIKKLKE